MALWKQRISASAINFTHLMLDLMPAYTSESISAEKAFDALECL
jgi:hypothetical protein